ncbi:MAG: hypothetical protein WDO13_04135 [Verrucomicrobiota bacterium]
MKARARSRPPTLTRVRPGVNGVINNDGIIESFTTGDSGNDGIDAQTNTGITIVNASTNNAANPNLIEGARHGITGGITSGTGSFTMSITNNSNGIIQGNDGSGINIDGINGNELVTIKNDGKIIGDGVDGDGDGVDVDGPGQPDQHRHHRFQGRARLQQRRRDRRRRHDY